MMRTLGLTIKFLNVSEYPSFMLDTDNQNIIRFYRVDNQVFFVVINTNRRGKFLRCGRERIVG